MKQLVILGSTLLLLIVSSAFAGQLKDIYLKDGTHLRGVITNRTGHYISGDVGDENFMIKKSDIDKVELYIKNQDIGKLTLSDNEIVFRDFLWTDTKDDIEKKLDKLKGYISLKEIGVGVKFGDNSYNRNFLSYNLKQIKDDLKTCGNPIHGYSTQPINNFVQRIVLRFSSFDDKQLVSVSVNPKRKDSKIILNSLKEKYGEGERLLESGYIHKEGKDVKYKGYLKWTNGNVDLYASYDEIIYINTNNLDHVRLECQRVKSEEKRKVDSTINDQI